MNWKNIRTYLGITAIVLTVGLAGCDDPKSMEPMEFTQCFSPLDKPSMLLHSESFYRDIQRRCFGVRWKIPRAYFARKWISYHPVAESFILRVNVPDRSPAVFLPKDKQFASNTEVTIDPVPADSIDRKFHRDRKTYLGPDGGVRAKHQYHGMTVYDASPFRLNDKRHLSKGIFLIPPGEIKFYVLCETRLSTQVDGLKPDNTCIVSNHIHGKIWLQYPIQVKDLPKILSINEGMLVLIKGFIRPN